MNIPEINFREEKWRKNFLSTCHVLQLDKYLPNSRKHLDFGCGIGIFAKLLSQRYPKTIFVGQDIDSDYIKIAKSRHKSNNLKFKCKEKIDDDYDSISCIFMLHETDDPPKVLKNIVDSMDPKSKIFVIEFRRIPKNKFHLIYGSDSWLIDFDEYYERHSKWSIKEFEELCMNAGLKTLDIAAYDKCWLTYIGQKADKK